MKHDFLLQNPPLHSYKRTLSPKLFLQQPDATDAPKFANRFGAEFTSFGEKRKSLRLIYDGASNASADEANSGKLPMNEIVHLAYAAFRGNVSVLLGATVKHGSGALVTAADYDKRTPLMLAVCEGRREVWVVDKHFCGSSKSKSFTIHPQNTLILLLFQTNPTPSPKKLNPMPSLTSWPKLKNQTRSNSVVNTKMFWAILSSTIWNVRNLSLLDSLRISAALTKFSKWTLSTPRPKNLLPRLEKRRRRLGQRSGCLTGRFVRRGKLKTGGVGERLGCLKGGRVFWGVCEGMHHGGNIGFWISDEF